MNKNKRNVLAICVAIVVSILSFLLLIIELKMVKQDLEQTQQVLVDAKEATLLLEIELYKRDEALDLSIGQMKAIEAKAQDLEVKLETLQQSNEELRKQVKQKNGLISDLKKQAAQRKKVAAAVMPSRGTTESPKKTLEVVATAYTAYCTGCSGKTATGLNLRENPDMKVIAVDPNVIPLGSKVYVEGYGYAIAGDTGGAIKGNKIDVFIPTKSEARKWGRKTITIEVLGS